MKWHVTCNLVLAWKELSKSVNKKTACSFCVSVMTSELQLNIYQRLKIAVPKAVPGAWWPLKNRLIDKNDRELVCMPMRFSVNVLLIGQS